MTLNEVNMDCLVRFAENVLQCDIKLISSFQDISLFYGILNEPSEQYDIECLLEKLSDFFNTNIQDTLNIIDTENLNDFELLKLLLLCIIIHILTSDSKTGTNNLINLSDKFPQNLQENFCEIIGPLIIKFTEKSKVLNEDLDKVLLFNDKENQTTFFSPIREKHKKHMIKEQVLITAQKKKIHDDIKSFKSFDPFPMGNNSSQLSPSSGTSSPFLKLVQFVQSPVCQDKMSLMKTNRSLERNMNELEHQLFWKTTFESELDNTINIWKQKCRDLEKDVKSMQSVINNKDDVIAEKNDRIDQLEHFAIQNKRLDEKMKDYQVKVNEIQLLNKQLEETCEQNQTLKIENRDFSHFKTLAIERRVKIESLTTELNVYKDLSFQLTETRKRLVDAESQLMELNNHIHSLQRNKANDSMSEVSLNSSIYGSESLACIVEMERDELKNELLQLKDENAQTQQINERMKVQITDLMNSVNIYNKKLDKIKIEQDSTNDLCLMIKEDFSKIESIDFSTVQIDNNLTELFLQINTNLQHYKDDLIETASINSNLSKQLNSRSEIEKELNLTLELLQKKVTEKDALFMSIGEILLENEEFADDEQFYVNIINVLLSKENTLEENKITINNLKLAQNEIQNLFQNDFNLVKANFKELRVLSESYFNSIPKEVVILKDSIYESIINPLMKTVHDINEKSDQKLLEIASLNDEIGTLNSRNNNLIHELETASIEHNRNVNILKIELEKMSQEKIENLTKLLTEQFNETITEITTKHTKEENEMKNDMTKLIEEYQECLASLENVSIEYENKLEMKDELIRNEKIMLNKIEDEMEILKNTLTLSDKQKADLSKEIKIKNEEICTQKVKIENGNKELLAKDVKIEKIEQLIFETQEKEKATLVELNKFKLVLDQYENSSIEFESTKSGLMKSNEEINKLQLDLFSKNHEIEIIMTNHSEKMKYITDDIAKKDQELLILSNEIEMKNKILTEKDINIAELKTKEIQLIEVQLSTSEERAKFESIKENYDDLQLKYIELVHTSSETNNEFECSKAKLLEADKEISQLKIDLSAVEFSMKNQSEELTDRIAQLQLSLKEKEKVLEINKENLSRLEMLMEEERTKQQNALIKLDYLTIIDEKYVELTKRHEELKLKCDKCYSEYEQASQQKELEVEQLKSEINQLKTLNTVYVREKEEVCSKLQKMNNDLVIYKENIEKLKCKCLEMRENLDKIREEKVGISNLVSEQDAKIMELNQEISDLENGKKLMEDSSSDYLKKMSSLEEIISHNNQEITKLTDSLTSDNLAMKSLKEIIVDLELSNKTKQLNLDNLQQSSSRDTVLFQQTISDLNSNLELLRDQLEVSTKEKDLKIQELSVATSTLENFNSKIQNLESSIQVEMMNYSKVNDECKHIEQESNQFRTKYHNLLNQNRDEISSLQLTILELTNNIRKIEEERDDEIHKMEKLFNSKIFDLQQSLEEKSSEIESVKLEIIESRKVGKTARATLELEKERLQKALLTRQNQFGEEKAQLVLSIEKEREEKLKYKEYYEVVISGLENDLTIAEQQTSVDMKQMKSDYDKLNDKFKEAQLIGFRACDDLKAKESDFKKEVIVLKTRVAELEPLVKKIELLESTSHRLMNKVTELEDSEIRKELKKLRDDIKVKIETMKLLENEKSELISTKVSTDRTISDMMNTNDAITNENSELKVKLSYVKDRLRNQEFLDKTRLQKIDNLEREIDSMKSENDSLKNRYQKLREMSEAHMERVVRNHEETVNNYIERIGSLTKDVEISQEQIQLLMVEKNMVKEQNVSLKRSAAELTSKLSNLKSVLREHTENEIRQLNDKYSESNRYSRMSQWTNRPQLGRQLPPVNCIDSETATALHLDSTSKMRFESFVCSPYLCEDEPSVFLHKQFPPLVSSRSDNIRKVESNENIAQFTTPLKKKKDGIRQQITTKIRKSLHIESGNDSKPWLKKASSSTEISETPVSLKNEMFPASSSSKPPILPRKNIAAKLKSSQVNVIDLDELRQRHQKRQSITRDKKEQKKMKNDLMLSATNSVSSTTTFAMVPSTSICSLFEQSDDLNKITQGTSVNSIERDHKYIESSTLDSPPFTQRPKTPKPNSIIKRLIRKSKMKTPKRKPSPLDSFLS